MRKVILAALLLAMLFMPVLTANAAPIPMTPSGIPLSELEERIDAVVAEHLHQSTPGAAIAVVKDGEIIFSKGYGYADIERQIPVDPAATIFEYGSISKTFVWVSVMQLVEQGLLDLDVDIATYLPEDFYRELNFEKPFTMRDILNHSGGFADSLFSILLDVDKVDNEITFREGLLLGQPMQIYEPGTASVYSNFASGLAGYVVEHISGQEYSDFERENILVPAGMTQTRNQPDWLNDHEYLRSKAIGYFPDNRGGFKEEIWSYVPMYPAGAVNGTAEDLARYAIALTPPLNTAGPFFANRETLDIMFSPSTLNPAALRGTYHGFLRYDGAVPSIGHGGNTAGFTANFAVAPSERFGYVILTNAAGEADILASIHQLLMGNSIVSPSDTNLPNAVSVEGRYVDMRRLEGTVGEFATYLNISNVTAIDENTIKVEWGGPYLSIYQQVEPYIFRSISSNDPFISLLFYELHFRMENGTPVQIMIGNGFDMSPLPEGRSMPILIGSLAVVVISVIFFLFMPIILLIRYLCKKEKEITRFHLLSNGLMLCGTMVVVNVVILFIRVLVINSFRLFSEIIPHIWANYALLALSAGFLIASALSLKVSGIKIRRKVLYGVTILLLAMLFLVLWNWNFFALR